MRLWALLAVLLLSSLVLAGCSDGGDDDDDDATSSSSTSTTRSATTGATTSGTSTSGSTTSSQPGQPGQEPSNTAPVGSMAIAPVANVSKAFNFTLNGTDPEGDNIVWDLLFGDGQSTAGAVLPASAGHTYAAVGLYNATFTISDGRLQTTYNLTVNVTQGAAGGQAFTGGWAAAGPIGCEQIADGDNLHQLAAELEGIQFVTFAIEPSAVGQAFRVDVAATSPFGMWEIDFFDGAAGGGSNLGYYPETDPTAFDSTSFVGIVPGGAVSAVFFPCTAGDGEFTFTAPA